MIFYQMSKEAFILMSTSQKFRPMEQNQLICHCMMRKGVKDPKILQISCGHAPPRLTRIEFVS